MALAASENAAAVPRLAMSKITKRFGATLALDAVCLDVQAGEIHALIGENGAGKSTLMKILAGAEKPDAGEMLLDGAPFHPANPRAARRSGIAMIYQELALAPHLSVEANISLGNELQQGGLLQRGAARQRAKSALAQLGYANLPLDAPVHSISPAARQIVEIARALASGCRLLVLDEPTSSLTAEDTRKLFAVLKRLKERDLAIIYISHFLDEIKEISDRLTVLRDGKNAGGGRTAEIATEEIIRLMIGRRMAELYPRSPRTASRPILTLRNLSGTSKVKNADLILHAGEVVGIAGLMGAGRTELLRLIFGLEQIQRGEIQIGVFLGAAPPHKRWRQGLGMLSEDRQGEGLALGMSIADNLTLSHPRPLGPAGFMLPSRKRAIAAQWIQRLQIRCRSPQQQVGALSGGNQQKVALARLLYHNVDVLLLDEPTRGVDINSKKEIYAIINQLAAGQPAAGIAPKAVIIVSSYLPELLGICDRIAVMVRGVLGPAKPVADWTEHTLLAAATGQAMP